MQPIIVMHTVSCHRSPKICLVSIMWHLLVSTALMMENRQTQQASLCSVSCKLFLSSMSWRLWRGTMVGPSSVSVDWYKPIRPRSKQRVRAHNKHDVFWQNHCWLLARFVTILDRRERWWESVTSMMSTSSLRILYKMKEAKKCFYPDVYHDSIRRQWDVICLLM